MKSPKRLTTSSRTLNARVHNTTFCTSVKFFPLFREFGFHFPPNCHRRPSRHAIAFVCERVLSSAFQRRMGVSSFAEPIPSTSQTPSAPPSSLTATGREPSRWKSAPLPPTVSYAIFGLTGTWQMAGTTDLEMSGDGRATRSIGGTGEWVSRVYPVGCKPDVRFKRLRYCTASD